MHWTAIDAFVPNVFVSDIEAMINSCVDGGERLMSKISCVKMGMIHNAAEQDLE